MFLHQTAKLVHLNLAPENIWITSDGSWKLAGFGFALSAEVGSTRYLLDCGTVVSHVKECNSRKLPFLTASLPTAFLQFPT